MSKKIKQIEEHSSGSSKREEKQEVAVEKKIPEEAELTREEISTEEAEDSSSKPSFDVDGFFDFSVDEGPLNLEWVSQFLELDETTLGLFSQ